jgi:hypothetical protein
MRRCLLGPIPWQSSTRRLFHRADDRRGQSAVSLHSYEEATAAINPAVALIVNRSVALQGTSVSLSQLSIVECHAGSSEQVPP